MALPRLTVIGGGISGLTVTRLLAPHFETCVFEKSKRLSGRCASLLFRGHLIDHGAPYFTLCDGTYKFLDAILGDLLVPVPGAIEPQPQSQPYYVLPSANELGERLINGVRNVEIRRSTRVHRETGASLLSIMDTRTSSLPACDAVVCTVPLPQAAMLYANVVDITEANRKYVPTLVAALAYTKESIQDSKVYARKFDTSSIISLATCESMKPGRQLKEDAKNEVLFLVHASLQFSRLHFDQPTHLWLPLLRDAFESQWNGMYGARCIESFAKRWRYAQIADNFDGKKFMRKSESLGVPVYFAGDAIESESGIRGALLSAAVTAKQIGDDFGIALEKSPLFENSAD